MQVTRRAVLLAIPGVVAAPAIVRASSIMKIKPLCFPTAAELHFDEALWCELAFRERLREERQRHNLSQLRVERRVRGRKIGH